MLLFAKNFCEPQLSKKRLIRSINGKKGNDKDVKIMLEILTWADGKNSLLEVAEKSDLPIWDFYFYLNVLKK